MLGHGRLGRPPRQPRFGQLNHFFPKTLRRSCWRITYPSAPPPLEVPFSFRWRDMPIEIRLSEWTSFPRFHQIFIIGMLLPRPSLKEDRAAESGRPPRRQRERRAFAPCPALSPSASPEDFVITAALTRLLPSLAAGALLTAVALVAPAAGDKPGADGPLALSDPLMTRL